jgi:tetratricopeptide (TPR) repeat protein
MWQRWRRFSLFFLASLLFGCIFHAWSLAQASIPNSQSPILSQEPYYYAVQQGIERYQVGKFTEAIALWQQVLPQITEAKDRAGLHNNLALAYRQIGQLAEAIAQWEQAIQIYQRQDDEVGHRQLPKLLTEQAQAYNELGQNRRAITLLQSAVELADQNQDARTQAATWGALGNAYWALGNYEKALESHQASLQIARQLNYPDYIATSLNNLGNVYISRSERYRYQANIARRVEGDNTENARLTQLAEQDIAAAQSAFEQSLHESQALGGIAQVKALLNLNRLLAQLPSPDEVAITKNRDQLLALIETLPDSRDKAYVLINLAESLRRQACQDAGVQECRNLEGQGRNTPASLLLEKALSVARNTGDRRAESFALGGLGQLHQSAGQGSTAMDLTRKAQFAAQQINAADSLYRWQWQAGRFLKASGKTKDAIASYEQAITTLQSIRNNLLACQHRLAI